MKKTLLIAFLIVPFLGVSQTKKPIDGALGVKFKSSMAAVKEAMKGKGQLDKENSNESTLVYTDVSLGSRSAESFLILFLNDKVFREAFIFKPVDQPQTLDYFNSLVHDLNESYGKGEAHNNFKSPFTFGDGHEVLAIQEGYAKIITTWKSDKNTIMADIDHQEDDLSVRLIYTDGELEAEQQSQNKAKEKSDL